MTGPRATARRALLAAGAAAAAAPVLAACGSPRTGGRAPLRFQSLAWQKESVAANKQLVAAWNRAHPDIPVAYQQGSWDTVHDQLVTAYEGGEAPDIVHDASDDLSDFALGGYLADLEPLLPASLLHALPSAVREMGRYGGKLYGVPFLQEPRVLIANRRLLDAAPGIRRPTVEHPWTWDEFAEAAARLSHGSGDHRRYGTAWPMKEPVSVTLNLSLAFGGPYFARAGSGYEARFGDGERALPRLIRDQVHGPARSAPASALGMGGSDALPGFFAGRYAMLPLGFSYRQQVQEQAPKGFAWTVLPSPAGPRGAVQGVSPQTLSISYACPRKQDAARFLAFFLSRAAMARLAAGDWMLPTAPRSAADPAMPHGRALGWDTGLGMMDGLRAAPSQRVRGYAEWKDKTATPAFQEFYAGRLSLDGLGEQLTGAGNNILRRWAER